MADPNEKPTSPAPGTPGSGQTTPPTAPYTGGDPVDFGVIPVTITEGSEPPKTSK